MLWMLVGALLLSWLYAAFVVNLGTPAHLLLVGAVAVVVYALGDRNWAAR